MTAHHLPTTDAPSETESTPEESQPDDSAASHEQAATPEVDELLGLLSDEYACRILCALDDGPLSADDLLAHCEMSRPTVYRRLDQLTAVGIVDSQLVPSGQGHHRQEFRLRLAAVSVEICDDGLDGAVQITPRS